MNHNHNLQRQDGNKAYGDPISLNNDSGNAESYIPITYRTILINVISSFSLGTAKTHTIANSSYELQSLGHLNTA